MLLLSVPGKMELNSHFKSDGITVLNSLMAEGTSRDCSVKVDTHKDSQLTLVIILAMLLWVIIMAYK